MYELNCENLKKYYVILKNLYDLLNLLFLFFHFLQLIILINLLNFSFLSYHYLMIIFPYIFLLIYTINLLYFLWLFLELKIIQKKMLLLLKMNFLLNELLISIIFQSFSFQMDCILLPFLN